MKHANHWKTRHSNTIETQCGLHGTLIMTASVILGYKKGLMKNDSLQSPGFNSRVRLKMFGALVSVWYAWRL